jgi:GTP cyclohydrolase II
MQEHNKLNGDPGTLAVERSIAELRRGRVVLLHDGQRRALIAAVETATTAQVAALGKRAPNALRIVLTGQRAQVLGSLTALDRPQSLRLQHPVDLESMRQLVGIAVPTVFAERFGTDVGFEPCDALGAAAVALTKHARLLPAVLRVDIQVSDDDASILQVSIADIELFSCSRPGDLQWVSDARVPLAGHEDCRFVLFRDSRDGSEHVAVLIGTPDSATAVPVRLHSACLTGDLLGSLRCDCGDQLRTAVEDLAAAGGGLLLYLAQEGRGIGLANKLRAYRLQDAGLDTIDADHHLGFEADERSYAVAAGMLRALGMLRIRLLTNNPQKIGSLREAGIEVVDSQLLLGGVNEYNVRYLRAKRERAGHLVPEIRNEDVR